MGLTKAGNFFSEEEKKKISDTTREVECCTIGEVAVMVVSESDRYHEAEVLGGVFFGGLFALIVAAVHFHSSLWFFVPLSLILFFPGRFLVRKISLLKTPFIGWWRKERAVGERALRAFYEKGLYKTRANTGVLFFISVFERKVWVLADKGIHERIGQETLDKFATKVSRGISEGRACDALCEAIREAGKLLAKHFPKTPDDTDELPDDVIIE